MSVKDSGLDISLRTGDVKLRPRGQIQLTAYFCTVWEVRIFSCLNGYNLNGYIISTLDFASWSKKPKIFTILLLAEKVCRPSLIIPKPSWAQSESRAPAQQESVCELSA